jgi:hypothetical protein
MDFGEGAAFIEAFKTAFAEAVGVPKTLGVSLAPARTDLFSNVTVEAIATMSIIKAPLLRGLAYQWQAPLRYGSSGTAGMVVCTHVVGLASVVHFRPGNADPERGSVAEPLPTRCIP